MESSVFCVEPEKLAALRNEGPIAMGIDEAGRGPVLGPMVYACFFCPVSKKDLKGAGYADSKTLTEKQREGLFDKIKASPFGWKAIPLHAEDLSNKMTRRVKYNLNLISHDAAASLIRFVQNECGLQVQEVYVDTVGDPQKYRAKLEELFPGVTVVVEKKADSLFPVVSAASICAKVVRDTLLQQWKFQEKLGPDVSRVFGSGYPGDPKTKSWLRQNCDPVFGFPSLIRFSWKTVSNLLEEVKACHVAYGDEDEEQQDSDDEDDGKKKSSSKKKRTAPPKPTIQPFTYRPGKRSRYFVEREMAVANDF